MPVFSLQVDFTTVLLAEYGAVHEFRLDNYLVLVDDKFLGTDDLLDLDLALVFLLLGCVLFFLEFLRGILHYIIGYVWDRYLKDTCRWKKPPSHKCLSRLDSG